MTEACAVLALMLVAGKGRAAVNRVSAAADQMGVTVAEMLRLPQRELVAALPVGLQDVAGHVLSCGPSERARANRMLRDIAQSGAKAVLPSSADYPPALRAHLGLQAPPILFIAGNPALLGTPCAGIVGARQPTAAGRRLAAACARTFAQEGICVLSGGAAGIDTAAHSAALRHGGCTLVVLPQGILTYRPPEDIAHAIRQGSAALLSAFVPTARWGQAAAVTRNATIAALSRIICVIEPRKTGGSIRTARCALEQGKYVLSHTTAPNERLDPAQGWDRLVPLLDGSDTLDEERLLRIWRAASDAPKGQRELG